MENREGIQRFVEDSHWEEFWVDEEVIKQLSEGKHINIGKINKLPHELGLEDNVYSFGNKLSVEETHKLDERLEEIIEKEGNKYLGILKDSVHLIWDYDYKEEEYNVGTNLYKMRINNKNIIECMERFKSKKDDSIEFKEMDNLIKNLKEVNAISLKVNKEVSEQDDQVQTHVYLVRYMYEDKEGNFRKAVKQFHKLQIHLEEGFEIKFKHDYK